MRKWSLKILSAFLTFALGLSATAIVRFRLASTAKVQPVYEIANIRAKLPSPDTSEETRLPYEIVHPHSVSISPYEIKRLIEEDDLSPCQRGGYSGYRDFGSILDKLSLETSDAGGEFPRRCESPSKAYAYSLELDGTAGKETLLRLDFGTPDATLYLIFKRIRTRNSEGEGWSLLGAVPYPYGPPFFPPSHRVLTAGGERWLVIDFPTGHGSAFGSSAEDWYEISEDGVIRVLTYQKGLFIGMGNPTVDSDTRVLSIEERDGVITVLLQTSTSYGGYRDLRGYRDLNAPFHLWTAKKKATFIKGQGMKEFLFDPFHSEMPEALHPPYYGDSVSTRDFLKYNYRELLKIARERWTQKKEWLFDFLKTVDDSVEKQSILETAIMNDKCRF